MQQPQHQDTLSGLLYRVESVEKDILALRQQLSLYEPTKENELKLQSIKDTTLRIETELSKVKDRVEVINARMIIQEQESTTRDAKQREETSTLQIRVLWGILSILIGIGTAVLIGYITHFFH